MELAAKRAASLNGAGTAVPWVGVGLGLAAYAAAVLFGAPPLLRSAIYLAFPAVALAAAYRAWAASSSRGRTSWLLLALYAAAMLLGDALWCFTELVLGVPDPPTPSLIDAAYFAGYGCMLAGVLLMLDPHSGPTKYVKLRYLLDLMLVALVGSGLVFVAVVLPAQRLAPQQQAPEMLTLAAYPFADIVLMSAFAALLLGFKRSPLRLWHVLLGVSLFVTGAADLAWMWVETVSGWDPTRPVTALLEVGWLAGYGAFIIAAARYSRVTRASKGSSRESSMAETAPPLITVPGWWDYALPAGVLLFLPVLMFVANRDASGWNSVEVLVTLLSLALATLVVARSAVLTAENKDLAARSATDPLTGLYNHRFFHERLALEIDLASAAGESLSLALIDLDEFAVVNDMYGHPSGDECLKWAAGRIRTSVRSRDWACRVGGDEFGIILRNTDASEAEVVCRRILNAIGVRNDFDVPLRASIGVVSAPRHGLQADELVRKADGALYWVKHNGGAQVLVYDADVVQDLNAEERALRVEEQSYLHMVQVLAAAVDARDSYTQHHSRTVAELAGRFAGALGMSERSVALIESAALLHDVGKIGVSDLVLRKTGPLTEEEMAQIRQHPELGRRILCATPFTEVLPWILSHHERWDGTGYPAGLAGEEIPFEARLLAICDAFDAMTSDRPYRAAMPREQAIAEVRKGAGSQFDPELAAAFIEHEIGTAGRPEETSGMDLGRSSVEASLEAAG